MTYASRAVPPRLDPSHVATFLGEFGDQCDNALSLAAGAPVLAFLDLKGLAASTYEPLLAAPGSEILMLVADAGSVRSGVVNADDRRFERAAEAIHCSPSLFADHDLEDLQRVEAERVARRAHLEATSAGIERLLAQALGSDSEAAKLKGTNPEEVRTRIVARIVRSS